MDESENPDCVMSDYVDNLQTENAGEVPTHIATISSYYGSYCKFRYTNPTPIDQPHDSFDYETINREEKEE